MRLYGILPPDLTAIMVLQYRSMPNFAISSTHHPLLGGLCLLTLLVELEERNTRNPSLIRKCWMRVQYKLYQLLCSGFPLNKKQQQAT